ncbi:hypothetical protein OQA88_292 [Cercophora sp. LCS_1]
MSDNVGLSTPRGSGTSGYVQRNLAHFRPRDNAAPYAPRDTDALRHKPRQPDQGLLEHDRKREVEVKVFELRDRLEEDGVDEDEIEQKCDALRQKLLAELESIKRKGNAGAAGPKRNLKAHQVHELADAKLKESERLRQALKISRDYEEGGHWRKQEERLRRAAEPAAERDSEDRRRDSSDRETPSERERDNGNRMRASDWGRERERERDDEDRRSRSRERGGRRDDSWSRSGSPRSRSRSPVRERGYQRN